MPEKKEILGIWAEKEAITKKGLGSWWAQPIEPKPIKPIEPKPIEPIKPIDLAAEEKAMTESVTNTIKRFNSKIQNEIDDVDKAIGIIGHQDAIAMLSTYIDGAFESIRNKDLPITAITVNVNDLTKQKEDPNAYLKAQGDLMGFMDAYPLELVEFDPKNLIKYLVDFQKAQDEHGNLGNVIAFLKSKLTSEKFIALKKQCELPFGTVHARPEDFDLLWEKDPRVMQQLAKLQKQKVYHQGAIERLALKAVGKNDSPQSNSHAELFLHVTKDDRIFASRAIEMYCAKEHILIDDMASEDTPESISLKIPEKKDFSQVLTDIWNLMTDTKIVLRYTTPEGKSSPLLDEKPGKTPFYYCHTYQLAGLNIQCSTLRGDYAGNLFADALAKKYRRELTQAVENINHKISCAKNNGGELFPDATNSAFSTLRSIIQSELGKEDKALRSLSDIITEWKAIRDEQTGEYNKGILNGDTLGFLKKLGTKSRLAPNA